MTLPIHPELGYDFDYETALQDFRWALSGTHKAPAAQEIAQAAIQLGALLLKKNTAYGDSALSPVECFAQGLSTSQRLGVRMDDKISRMARGNADGEDPQMDLAGYLILLRIALAREKPQPDQASLGFSNAADQEKPRPTPYAADPIPALTPSDSPVEAIPAVSEA